jgi:hypothetical protein
MDIVKVNGLIGPKDFFDLTEEQISDISNGCGPSGWGWLVPDRFRLFGIKFKPGCDIHDYCYAIRMPKDQADKLLLDNLLTLSDRARFGFRFIANRFAFDYYLAVKNGGSGAYNNAKETNK